MGGNRTAPSRIINTPRGPRERTRMAGESMEKDQRRRRSAFAPRKQRPMFTDRGERVQDKDMEARRSRRMERREERKQTFGDDFREERKERRERRRERRRQARDFFGRAKKPNRPIMPKDRRSGLGGADDMPEEIRKRRGAIEGIGRNFGTTINMSADATPEQRKQAFDKLVAERGSIRPFPRDRSRDQNIARTDV